MAERSSLTDYTMIILAVVTGVGSIILLIAGGSAGFFRFGWSEVSILTWDAFLSAIFFIQHSGMVRRSFRSRLAGVVDARYHGAIYAIGSGIALSVVVIFWQRSDVSLLVLGGIPRYIATLCIVLAVLIFAVSIYSLRTFDMLGIGPIRAHIRGIEHRPGPFIVRGPYRWMRHPLYFCVIVLFWANPYLTADRLLFNLLWTGWIYIGTRLEERDLVREFGEEYRRYQKAVPMLVPWRGPVPKTALIP